MDKFCALCWQEIAPDEAPLARRCDDGSVLFCHRTHSLTARVNGFREIADLPEAPVQVALSTRRWPAKILA